MGENICEENTFKAIYIQHSESLRNFLYYKSGNMQLAEDLAHDAFSRMWENCSKVVNDKARSYVFTIANNLFLNRIKHQKIVLKFKQNIVEKNDTKDPQYLMEEQEVKEKLITAISDLPETQREAFLMNRVDKLTYKEIAATLNISVKAVEKRMHKAINALKNIL